MPCRRTRSAPPSNGCSSSPMRTVPIARGQLLETRPTHQRSLVLLFEHAPGLGKESPVFPRRNDRLDVDVDQDRDAGFVAPAIGNLIGHGRGGCQAVEPNLPTSERLDQLEGQWTGTQNAWLSVRSQRLVDGTGAEEVEVPSRGRRQIELDVMGVPLIGRRFDADAGKADRTAGSGPEPRIDRLAHVRIVRLFREDELTLVAQPTCQVHGHWSPGTGRAANDHPVTEDTQALATSAGCSCWAVTLRFNLEMASVVSLASILFSTEATPAVSTDLRITGTM